MLHETYQLWVRHPNVEQTEGRLTILYFVTHNDQLLKQIGKKHTKFQTYS